jgi:tetratricopeptide (TPR) repeat protein
MHRSLRAAFLSVFLSVSLVLPLPAQPPSDSKEPGKAYEYQGTYDEDYAALRYDEARYFMEKKMYLEAELRMKDVLSRQPDRSEAHYALGSIYFRSGRTEDAIKELDSAMKNPDFRERAVDLKEQILSSLADKPAA